MFCRTLVEDNFLYLVTGNERKQLRLYNKYQMKSKTKNPTLNFILFTDSAGRVGNGGRSGDVTLKDRPPVFKNKLCI